LILLIDVGNSRIKWAWKAPEAWRSESADLDGGDPIGPCERAWQNAEAPERVVLSSVLDEGRTGELVGWIEHRWPVVVHRVRSQARQLGVTNGYRDPATLGSDRWAALIGARSLSRDSWCVVDCGSAVTVDALSSDGRHLGGVIFPGVKLLRAALHAGTAGVRGNDGRDDSCLGRATAAGLAAGVLYGLCGAIERLVAEQRRVLGPDARVLLTGGDGPAVASRLGIETTLAPDLVLRGLEQIADRLV
jgi:type III pantothenate kinase